MANHTALPRRTVVLILIGIIIVAAGTRFYGLDKQSLWYDEVYEEKAFQSQFLGDKTFMVPDTPPLHLFFIYPVTKIYPKSDFALRMVPFTFGLLSVPLLFLLGRQLFNEKVGFIASFLLAISPFHIWYSQDARMYALQWMLAIISLIYFSRALEHPNRSNFIWYVISTVAGLYTNQLSVFLLILQALYLLVFFRKYQSKFLKWIVVFCSVVILYSPWIVYNLTTLMDRGTSFPRNVSLLINIIYTFFAYFAGFSIGPSLRDYHLNLTLSVIKPYITEIGALMIVYSAMFVLGLWSLRKDHPRLILLLLLISIPIIGLIILINTVMIKMSYNVRYTGISSFGFILLIAKGIDWLSLQKPKLFGNSLSIIALVVMTGFSGYSYANYQFDKRYHKEDIRGAVSYIKDNMRKGDGALCIEDPEVFNYYSGSDIQCMKFPMIPIKDVSTIEVEMQKLIKGKKRLWMILSREWYRNGLWGQVKDWLDTNYEEIKQLHKGITEIANVQIYCYDLTKTQDRRFTTEDTEKDNGR